MPVNKSPKGKGNKTPKKADIVADQKEEVEDVEVAKNDVKETPKAGKAKAKETPKATPAKKDAPKATPVKETPKSKAKTQAPPKKEESESSGSESDSESDSSEEETPKAVTKKSEAQKATPAKKETPKAEEKPKATPAKKETKAEEKAPKAKATPAKAPEPEESDDDEESDSDDSESEEEEEKEAMEVDNSKKRSAPETVAPAKNQKTESFQTPNTATNASNGDGERQVLFVGNLSFNTTQDSLFQQLAELELHPAEIRVAMNNGQCKGFAHIEFNSKQEIQSAVEKLDGFEIDGRNLRVEISEGKRPQQEKSATRVLFVGQLNYDSTIESVQEAFAGFGCPPQSVRIISNEDGSSRGFGYVEFNSAEEAQEAIKFNGYEIDGRQVKLDFAEDKRNGGGRGGFGGGRGGFGGGRGGRGGFGGGRGGRGDFGGRGGRGGRGGDFGGRGGRGFGGRGGRGGRGGDFGGRGGRGGRGDFAGKRITFS